MSTSSSLDRTISTEPGATLAPINRRRPTRSRPAHALTASPTRSRLTPRQIALAVILAAATLLLLVMLALRGIPTAAPGIDAPVPIPSAQPAPPPPSTTGGLA